LRDVGAVPRGDRVSVPPRGRVALVVVTWNSTRHLPDLFASLDRGCEGIADWELIVVDNASSDGTVELARSLHEGVVIVEMGRNAGYAAAVNAGIDAAKPFEAVLVLNPDLRLQPGAVTALYEEARHAGVGIVVPRMLAVDGSTSPSLRREPTLLRALGEALLGGERAGRYAPLGELVIDPECYERPTAADWAVGAAMLVTAECSRWVGPWDETFFMYSEETEFALRARDAGYALRYAPDAVVVHIGGEAHTSSNLWSVLTINRVRLYARRHGRFRSAVYRAIVVVNEGSRALAGRAQHRAALAALLTDSRRPAEVRGLP
jgi:GT2 family glycosyltransferase